MKKLIAAALLIAATSVTFAQDSAKVASTLKAKGVATYNAAWGKMDDLLKLTPTETAEWQSLNKTYAPQYKTIADNSALSKDEKQTQMAALHTQQEADLKKILTPAQNAEWTTIKKTVKSDVPTKTTAVKTSHTTTTRATRTVAVRHQ